MKRFLLVAIIGAFIISCKKDDDPKVFDFTISGIVKIDARVEETRTIRLLVTCNDATPENVYLMLEDVPAGITFKFDKVVGIPEYAANLEITIARTVAGGAHKLRLIGSSTSLIKEFPLEISIDKSLSASFTVYNGISFNPENYNSNLLDSALINIYKDEATYLSGIPDFKEYTKTGGKAYFYKLPAGVYLFTIEMGELSNVIQKRDVGGTIKGFIIAGLFRTKEEIINSAQPNALPGDLKFRDLNSDNKINENDLGQYDKLNIYEGEVNEKVIWIGK